MDKELKVSQKTEKAEPLRKEAESLANAFKDEPKQDELPRRRKQVDALRRDLEAFDDPQTRDAILRLCMEVDRLLGIAEGLEEEKEKSRAIDALDIRVKHIGPGSPSLVIVLMVFGFTKLAEVVGISSDDFARYLTVLAPIALPAVFGTTVPLETDATPLDTAVGSGMLADRPTAPTQYLNAGTPYIVPAILAIIVVAGAMWTLSNLSNALVDERKKLSDNLHNDMTEIMKERADFVDKLL